METQVILWLVLVCGVVVSSKWIDSQAARKDRPRERINGKQIRMFAVFFGGAVVLYLLASANLIPTNPWMVAFALPLYLIPAMLISSSPKVFCAECDSFAPQDGKWVCATCDMVNSGSFLDRCSKCEEFLTWYECPRCQAKIKLSDDITAKRDGRPFTAGPPPETREEIRNKKKEAYADQKRELEEEYELKRLEVDITTLNVARDLLKNGKSGKSKNVTKELAEYAEKVFELEDAIEVALKQVEKKEGKDSERYLKIKAALEAFREHKSVKGLLS